MSNFKSYLLVLGIVFVGLLFVSGVHNSYGFSNISKNGLMASLTQLAQTVDETVSASTVLNEMTVSPVPQEPSRLNQRDDFDGHEERPEDFVNPREIKDVYREMRDMRRELKRFSKSAKKLSNAENVKSEIDSLFNKIGEFETSLKEAERSGSGAREIIDEFRQAEIWEEINKLRSRVELPRELKMAERELTRLRKIMNQKSFQKLGLNTEALKSWIDESDAIVVKLRALMDAGNWEEISAETEDLHERAHPGEVSSVLFRLRDLYNRMKIIKDEEVKEAIEESLSEVKESFNQGDYRSAREILDNIYNDLERLIMKASKIGRKGGITEEEFDENLSRIKNIIDKKLGEREERENQQKGQLNEVPQNDILQKVEPQAFPFTTQNTELPKTSSTVQ